MISIVYTQVSVDAINLYIQQYRRYYQDLYADTGIWGEEQIIANYIQESISREDSIYALIEQRFAPDIVLGRTPMDTLLMPWRTKILSVSWRDEGVTRIITDIKIR